MAKNPRVVNEIESKEAGHKRRRENPQLNSINIEITCEVIQGEYNNPLLRYRRQVTKAQLITLLVKNANLHMKSDHYVGLELAVVKVEDFNNIVARLNKIKTKS